MQFLVKDPRAAYRTAVEGKLEVLANSQMSYGYNDRASTFTFAII